MKRILKLNIFIWIIIFINTIPTPKIIKASVNIPSWIRVGLEYKYKNTNRITINNDELLIGYEMKGEFIPEGVFQSREGFYVEPSDAYFVSINDYMNTYEEAQLLAKDLQALNLNAFPASLAHAKWTVYIGEFNSYKDAQAVSADVSDITGEHFIVKESINTRVVLKKPSEIVAVLEGEEAYPQFIGISSNFSDEVIDFGDRKYRGRMEFGRYGVTGITAVNIILFDEYLYGVVPSEMPSSWDIEALKAQSVVARNYAMLSMGKHKNSGYDLCDGQHCQAYKGYGSEAISSNKAVDETRGELLYYDDEIINSVYFASSGGHTEDSENVWITPLPYLKGVPDTYEENHQSWTKGFSKEQIEDLLISNGKNIGEVVDIQIESYTPSGRVKELKIIGTKGYENISKETIRTFFKSEGVSLQSRMFEIIKDGDSSSFSIILMGYGNISQSMSGNRVSVIGEDKKVKSISFEDDSLYIQGEHGVEVITYIPSTTVKGDFVFQGKGFGHGVGMSQWGAKGMAEQGYNYKQILSYYYTGTSVR